MPSRREAWHPFPSRARWEHAPVDAQIREFLRVQRLQCRTMSWYLILLIMGLPLFMAWMLITLIKSNVAGFLGGGLVYALCWTGFLGLGGCWKRWESAWESALCQLHPEGKEGLESLLQMGVQFFVAYQIGYWQAKEFMGLCGEFVRWGQSYEALYNDPPQLYTEARYPLMTWFWPELVRLLEGVEAGDRGWWKGAYLEFLHRFLSVSLLSKGQSLAGLPRRFVLADLRALGKVGDAASKRWLELLVYVPDPELKQVVEQSLASLEDYFASHAGKELLRAQREEKWELLHPTSGSETE
ncbi:hypothetical protein CTKA_00209 [Chthonomonas calidirosea]|uniref:Uncharacterized protein n=1 Tax=Chthonomonas calidirosea (strain DSM 23976 / ICMP 18418 / T49) TaxID=1303518 RepID=S0EU34_CHTCT|nr:hypothetical protein [Chthonomonas calidirosea]CCW34773.1 hypothetical protein CCALI_00951 [Chthonomonas calidirosea T49]CEK13837.1 hypothetical protein CTKA_00209 [Chthonomonas calidirosea]